MTRAGIKKLWLCNVGNNCQPCTKFSPRGRQSSAGVEYLTVGNCEEIFWLEGAFFLSRLNNLYLNDLQKLQVIWKGPTRIATLQNLTHLEIVECKRLQSIFSPMFAPNFPQLRDLHLQGCDELQQIIAIDQTLSSSSKDRLRPQFKLEAASGLEHVFGHKDEANVTDREDMLLPKISRLELLQLQSFVSFCPLNYLHMFSSWFTAIVEDCPKMIMCFAVDRNNLFEGRRQKLQLQEGKKPRQLSEAHEQRFLDLRELTVKNCGVQEVFQLKGAPLQMEEHKCFCSTWREAPRKFFYLLDHYKNVSLADLTILELSNFRRLKNIFAPTIARNLPNLKYLSIWECEDLQQIIAKDDGEAGDQISATSSVKELLNWNNCLEMKINKRFLEETQLLLPKLWMLDLLQLPSLSTYCPKGYRLEIPNLSSSIVEDCPKLTMSFTVINAELFVNAKT
ncbi:hypothetical protein DITRI_Ditri14bG0134500 [Diplodiscus trichospermus]